MQNSTEAKQNLQKANYDVANSITPALLFPEHLKHLEDEAFTDDEIAKLQSWGVRSITEAEASAFGYSCRDKNDCDRSSSGILFPFSNDFGQLRVDDQILRKGDRPAKYLTPTGSKSQAWQPKADVITEGFKDAAVGTLKGGIKTGALAGVSHYKALEENSGQTILFDSDGYENPAVMNSLFAASEYLGGKLQLVPPMEDYPKAGLVEFFKAGNTSDDYKKLIESAMKPDDFLLNWIPRFATIKTTRINHALDVLFKWALKLNLQDAALDDVVNQVAKVLKGRVSRSSIKSRLRRAIAKLAEENGELKKLSPVQKTAKAIEQTFGENALKLNLLTQEIELDDEPVTIDDLYFELGSNGHDVALQNVQIVSAKIAQENKYHPVQIYLEQCHAHHRDTSILDGIAARYFGQDLPIYDTFIKRWLIASVARIFKPACKHDTALILQGKQGLLKSTFFNILGGSWFCDSMGDAHNKDELLKAHQSWLIEWGELETVFGKSGNSKVKAFMTATSDMLRRPYGRQTEKLPRRFSICGTTNENDFLTDPTGDRRYLVVPVQKVLSASDFVDSLKKERDQIWGAAVELFRRGEQWWLTDQEAEIQQTLSKQFQSQDPWDDAIASFIEIKEWVSVSQILDRLGVTPDKQGRKESNRVTTFLKKEGWEQARQTYGKQLRGWIPPRQTRQQNESTVYSTVYPETNTEQDLQPSLDSKTVKNAQNFSGENKKNNECDSQDAKKINFPENFVGEKVPSSCLATPETTTGQAVESKTVKETALSSAVYVPSDLVEQVGKAVIAMTEQNNPCVFIGIKANHTVDEIQSVVNDYPEYKEGWELYLAKFPLDSDAS